MRNHKQRLRTLVFISGLLLACSLISLPALSLTGVTSRPGELDPFFGVGGRVTTALGSSSAFARAVAIQSDGKIVAAGKGYAGHTGNDFALARFEGGGAAPAHISFDFDGDSKADLSVFRLGDGGWYIKPSSSGVLQAQLFGLATDRLVPADYDGDGKTDLAVFRNGTWYRLNSSGHAFITEQFGQAGDLAVPGDYDGAGKADAAVFRAGVWHISRSSEGYTAFSFSGAADRPVVADYDGDGRDDVAVIRDGVWHILRSMNQSTLTEQFGAGGDVPLPSVYVPE